MASHHPIRKVVEAVIPDKLYFRIGDVARLCEVPAYVLRFWETEFPQLKPNKGGTGQRLYRRRDVEMALRIKALLYDEGYTIPGARQILKSERAEPKAKSSAVAFEASEQGLGLVASKPSPADLPAAKSAALHALRADLQALAEILRAPATAAAARPRAKVQTMRPRGSSSQSHTGDHGPTPLQDADRHETKLENKADNAQQDLF